MSVHAKLRHKLLSWYRENQRPLPWRENRDPYKIWISEVMLQQTTVQAVLPYFERFLEAFPTVQALAAAPEKKVLAQWAGLGYYSRARNIHRAAQALAENGFPQTYQELLELPGFGPYTARAVSSIAFDEPVGVVDGNVIRVVSRWVGREIEWWKTAGRNEIQDFVDQVVTGAPAGEVNQAVMDIGSTLCTPTKPSCLLCPCRQECVALKQGIAEALPLKKPKREREVWVWKPQVSIERGRLALTQETYAPFLKGHWLPPGSVSRRKQPPKKFHFKHFITHHDIFVEVQATPKPALLREKDWPLKWISLKQVSEYNPTSLLQKVLAVP